MVGGHDCISKGRIPAPRTARFVGAPMRDLSPAGHGHYQSLYAPRHYNGLFQQPTARGAMIRHKCGVRGNRANRNRGRRRRGFLGDDSVGLPAGTILRYNATWPDLGIAASLATVIGIGVGQKPKDVAAAISPTLSSRYGILIDSESDSSGLLTDSFGFTLIVHTNSDYSAAGDVKAIIDAEIANLRGAVPTSTISIVNQPASDAASAAVQAVTIDPTTGLPVGSPSGITDWLSNNWPVLAIAGIGIVIAREVL